jgi:hypothetical protein
MCSEICSRIAAGESIAKISRDDAMPHAATLWRWIYDDALFRDAYTRAVQARSMVQADEIRDLTEKAIKGEIPPDVARVVIDAAKWTAARLLPKIYGERQEVSVSHTHTHVLHLEALKEMADRGRARQDAQAIDVTPYPTLEHQVLDVSPALPASPEPRRERRVNLPAAEECEPNASRAAEGE